MALIEQQMRAGPAVPRPEAGIHRPFPIIRTARIVRLETFVPGLSALLLVLLAWEAAVRSGVTASYILPTPLSVLSSLGSLLRDGTLTTNALVTLEEAGGGLGIALVLALPMGYLVAHVKTLERLLSPLLAASQAIPAVAVAPLLVTGLGTGIELKVVVCAVIVIFPLMVNAITAFRGVAREYLEVARVFGVPAWERILRVELPLAAPVLLAGLKVGLTLSLTGAIVGEFVAADQGLGFLLNYYHESFNAQAAFATLVVLAVVAISLYSFVSLLERMVTRWQG